MPKVPATLVGDAESAQAEDSQRRSDFAPLDPGVYTARLSSVKGGVTGPDSKKPGSPKWDVEFDTIYDTFGKKQSGKLFATIPLTSEMSWKVAQFFTAFGVPIAGTDTDELINYRIRLDVGQRPITVGKRAGKIGNDINRYGPLQEGDTSYAEGQKLSQRLGGSKPTAAQAAPAAAPQTQSLAEVGDEAQQLSPVAGLQQAQSDIDF